MTVDVEGRHAVHATPHAAQEVLVDTPGVDVFGQLLVEQLDVEPELLGVRAEILVAQALLVPVEKVVRPHKFFSLPPPLLTIPTGSLVVFALFMVTTSTIALATALAAVTRVRPAAVLREP